MTIFIKWILSWIGFFVGSMVAGLLAMYVSELFELAFFGNLFAWGIYMRQIECPNCGTPIYLTTDDYYQRPRLMRVPVKIFKTKCHVCGWDLTKNP